MAETEKKNLEEAEEDDNLTLSQLEAEFAEFRAASRDVEKALEIDCENLTKESNRLREEAAAGRRAAAEAAKAAGAELERLQQALDKATAQLATQTETVRELESRNDALESKERQLEASLAELQAQYDKTLEENAFLTTRVDQANDQRQEEVQRLRDELRTAQEDLARQQLGADGGPAPPAAAANGSIATTGTNGSAAVLTAAVDGTETGEEVHAADVDGSRTGGDAEAALMLRELSEVLRDISAKAQRLARRTAVPA